MSERRIVFSLALMVLAGLALGLSKGTAYAQHVPGWAVPYGEAEQVAGRNLFQEHCIFCHALHPGQRAFGPSLYGVVGRKAGSVPGFPYSDALKNSGIVWDEDNLRKWIASTTNVVPTTLMPHTTVTDPAEQIFLVAFLKSLKAPPPAHR